MEGDRREVSLSLKHPVITSQANLVGQITENVLSVPGFPREARTESPVYLFRNTPFRSCPISAKVLSELALPVNENPSSEPENVPVATAGRNSAAKFVGSVGSEDCGTKCSTAPVAVHFMWMLTVAGTALGARNWKSSSTEACSTLSSAVSSSISRASSGTCTIQNKPEG
jgi:hypothetical protein